MIEYYTSELNPDCFWAAVDGVVVATWWNTRWVDVGTYRPVRRFKHKIEWNGKPYDPSFMFDKEQFQFVKLHGRERNHMDEEEHDTSN